MYKMRKTKLTKQQMAERLRGCKIVQLDFYTGEYVAEYPSMTALALDYDVPLGTIISNFNKTKCCMIRIKKYDLLLMRKNDYIRMLDGLEEAKKQMQTE